MKQLFMGIQYMNFSVAKKSLLICSVLLINTSLAADFKFGYVNVAKIFETSKPAKSIKAYLTNKFAPQQKELEKLRNGLIAEQKEMEAIVKKAPSIDKLSAADSANLKNKEKKFQASQIAFQNKAMMFQQIAQKTQDMASALVLDKTNSILKEISEKGGFDLVLTSQQLVYAKATYDLTDQVIEQLNTVNSADIIKRVEQAEKEQAKAMAAGGQGMGGAHGQVQAPTPSPAAK